jgi:uncharacterized protein YgbK (DUF1537 family)
VTVVRIVADDLTGALDAAAPLVGVAGPLPVLWDAQAALRARGSFVLDSESRDAPAPLPWSDALGGADLAYKKIDSLLRGRTIEEIAACLEGGGFASAVIAPAFPAQHRITRGGHQYWRPGLDSPWLRLETELLEELRRRGLPVRHAASPQDVLGSGCFVCDAGSDDDLRTIVRAGRALVGPVLWIGTAGLARALAGPGTAAPEVVLRAPILFVIGSHHPVTLAQLEQLAAHAQGAMIAIRPDTGDCAAAVEALAAALAARGRAALVFALPDGTGAEIAGPLFDRAMGLAIRRIERPGCLVVTGGATLFRLVRALGAQSLLVQGELMAGIAVSRLEGGLWPGATVISKSGAFGAPDLLVGWWQRAYT